MSCAFLVSTSYVQTLHHSVRNQEAFVDRLTPATTSLMVSWEKQAEGPVGAWKLWGNGQQEEKQKQKGGAFPQERCSSAAHSS